MKVRDVMTKKPAVCLPTTKLDEVARMMVDYDCGEIPVVKDSPHAELLGVITDRDICCRAIAARKAPANTTAAECMSTPVFSIPGDAEVAEALKVMEDKEVRRLPVVDAKGKCEGILSIVDIIEKAPKQYAQEVLRYSGGAAGAEMRH